MQVLVGTHVVLANGGIMAPVGTHVVALAAKHHSCPFVVLTGLHKLSPLFPHDPSVNFNDFRVSVPRHPFMASAFVQDAVFLQPTLEGVGLMLLYFGCFAQMCMVVFWRHSSASHMAAAA